MLPQHLHCVCSLSHPQKFKRRSVLETCLVRVIDTRFLKIMGRDDTVVLQFQKIVYLRHLLVQNRLFAVRTLQF